MPQKSYSSCTKHFYYIRRYFGNPRGQSKNKDIKQILQGPIENELVQKH